LQWKSRLVERPALRLAAKLADAEELMKQSFDERDKHVA
jgi:hypothetical protein